MKATLTHDKIMLELDRHTEFEPLLVVINLALGSKLRSANKIEQGQKLGTDLLMALADAVAGG